MRWLKRNRRIIPTPTSHLLLFSNNILDRRRKLEMYRRILCTISRRKTTLLFLLITIFAIHHGFHQLWNPKAKYVVQPPKPIPVKRTDTLIVEQRSNWEVNEGLYDEYDRLHDVEEVDDNPEPLHDVEEPEWEDEPDDESEEDHEPAVDTIPDDEPEDYPPRQNDIPEFDYTDDESHEQSPAKESPARDSDLQPNEIVLVTGTDGNTHNDAQMDSMAHQNRLDYANLHGPSLPFQTDVRILPLLRGLI